MKELNDIIQAYDKYVLQNKKMVLVTVVKVEGSSYRRPGARMLVTEDGEITGAISGGCLEGDALRKAQFSIFEQKNKLEIYDTTDDDDNSLGVQLGCNGIVYILFEPLVNNHEHNPINLLKKIAQQRKAAVLITVFNLSKNKEQRGTCIALNKDELYAKTVSSYIESSAIAFEKKQTMVVDEETESQLFQFIAPSLQLVIAGAGNDAQPLVEMASLLGWNTVIVDARPNYATQQRFAKATKICLQKPKEILSVVDVDDQTAFVLMTHNYEQDLAALQQLITSQCKYIGILGPKKKLYKMVDELSTNGININEDKLNNVYAPVGLDVGAETAEEIALSVIAEIKSVFSNRKGTSLKDRPTEIHNRTILQQ